MHKWMCLLEYPSFCSDNWLCDPISDSYLINYATYDYYRCHTVKHSNMYVHTYVCMHTIPQLHLHIHKYVAMYICTFILAVGLTLYTSISSCNVLKWPWVAAWWIGWASSYGSPTHVNKLLYRFAHCTCN